MVTIADDVFRGKAGTFGAQGLEVLYYQMGEGFLSPEEVEQELVQMIVEERIDFSAVNQAVLE